MDFCGSLRGSAVGGSELPGALALPTNAHGAFHCRYWYRAPDSAGMTACRLQPLPLGALTMVTPGDPPG